MERKNMVLLTVIAVATLLVAVVGATFAYFTAATATDSRDEAGGNKGDANVTTAKIQETITKSLTNVAGVAGRFEATDIYPGHKEVAALELSVTSTAGEVDAPVNIAVPFLYKVTKNELGSNVKVRVYRSAESAEAVTTPLGCAVHVDTENPTQMTEKCTIEQGQEATTFGTLVNEITLTGATDGSDAGEKTYELAVDHITVNDTSAHKYNYYVILEYVETSASQDVQQGKSLTGTITVA